MEVKYTIHHLPVLRERLKVFQDSLSQKELELHVEYMAFMGELKFTVKSWGFLGFGTITRYTEEELKEEFDSLNCMFVADYFYNSPLDKAIAEKYGRKYGRKVEDMRDRIKELKEDIRYIELLIESIEEFGNITGQPICK